ncbi:hypothetical protein V8E53_011522 [Lactarius tabidus]
MDMMAVASYFALFPTPQNSFNFSLSFKGDILNHLHNAEMPLELMIHLLPEFTNLCPVIRSTNAPQESVQPNTEHLLWPGKHWCSESSTGLSITFETNNCHTGNGETKCFGPCSSLCFRLSPLGTGPPWDVQIPMAGAFINKQVVAADFNEITQRANECTAEDLIKHREELWEEFSCLWPFFVTHQQESMSDDRATELKAWIAARDVHVHGSLV